MRSLRRRRWFLLLLLAGYVLAMTFGGCADKLILHPSTQPIDPGPARRELLRHGNRQIEIFTADSRTVAGEPEAFVLEFTGNATRAEEIARWVADRWSRHPARVWVMNYPGYGHSTGPASLAAIPKAAVATYDVLATRANGRPIFVAGNSLGTTAALHVAAQRNVAGLILQGPPPLRRMILKRHGWWNLWLVAGPVAMSLPAELDSISNAGKVTAPAVFVLNAQDSIVPIQYQRDVESNYAGPKRTIVRADGGHNSPIEGDDEQQLQNGIDWLWSQAIRERKTPAD